MIVEIVTGSVIDPKYSLPDGISNGTMAAEIHMQVYWCCSALSEAGPGVGVHGQYF
jgi:hypothetical protein